MKIFLLIHEQDTDAACGSDVRPFTNKQTALDAMRKGWEETASAWEYASREHDGEDECECRRDAAIIRDGGDVERWRIEEHDLAVPVSVAVEVSGGLVQGVYAKGADVDVGVFDLDVSVPSDEGDGIKTREEELAELIGSPGWKQVW